LLFDYDKDNGDNNIVNKSKELLAIVNEETGAPAVIVIKDTCAYFPNTWEKDLNPEIAEAEQLTQKARKLLGLKSGSGKPLVARYIAKSLAEKEPPEIPESIKKIITKASTIEWNKSCLKTLSLEE
jgi:hypothetical protein